MVLEAERNGCVREVTVIAAGLSIQDPRDRPSEKAAAADAAHGRFRDPDSDLIAYLNLWRYLEQRQRESSSSQFRRMCRAEYLNYLRVREWQDLYGQLRQVLQDMGVKLNHDEAPPEQIHRSVLAGLLSHIGVRDSERRDYTGARNSRFAIFPGSGLARRQPEWVMAAELVETTRLWARRVARIEPEWVEKLAGALLNYSYSEPHWDSRRAPPWPTNG